MQSFPLRLMRRRFCRRRKRALFGFALTLAFMPFLVLIGNFINAPIEKGIRQYYINDAKKCLKPAPI